MRVTAASTWRESRVRKTAPPSTWTSSCSGGLPPARVGLGHQLAHQLRQRLGVLLAGRNQRSRGVDQDGGPHVRRELAQPVRHFLRPETLDLHGL